MSNVDSIVYHNTTGDFTGKPGAAPLTSLEADYNNFKIKTDVDALIADVASVGAGIDTITQPTPGTLLITLTDATTFGPFTLPTAPMNGRGLWTASTPYAVNDLVYNGTALYVVEVAHTSGTSFDPSATDGLGHSLYGIVFDFALSANALRQATTRIETGLTHVLSAYDPGTLWDCTNAAGCAITIPNDTTYDAPVDTEVSFRQSAAGGLTFTAAVGVTYNTGVTAFDALTEDLGAVVTIKKTAANTWIGWGRFAEPT